MKCHYMKAVMETLQVLFGTLRENPLKYHNTREERPIKEN